MNFLTDSLTDTNGTALDSHTGELGAAWTQHPSFAVSVAIDANRAHVVSGTFAQYYASGTPASADYDVTTTIYIATTGAFYLASAGRMDTAANTLYWARLTNGSTELLKTVAGTTTSLGSGGAKTANAGESHTITLVMRGTSISTKWDGAADIGAVTDSAITAAGRAGLRFNSGTSSTGYHADAISGDDTSTAITFIPGSAGSTAFTTSSSTWSITGPSGLASGDLILLGAIQDTQRTVSSDPPGFTYLGSVDEGSDARLHLWYKVAGVSEAGPYSVTWSNLAAGLGFWAAYRGVDASVPIDVAWVTANVAASTTQSLGPISPVTAGAMLVGIVACDPGGAGESYAWDAPATERLDANTGTQAVVSLADYLLGSPASTSLSGTISASEATATAILALRPAVIPAAATGDPEYVGPGIAPGLIAPGSFRRPTTRAFVAPNLDDAAAVLGLTFVRAHDLSVDVSFISSPGYVISRHAGAGTPAPLTSTDTGWSEIANVYPSTGGLVSVALPTNDDDYTLAVASRSASGAVGVFSTVDVFALAPAVLLAWDYIGAIGQITTTRRCRARFEIDRETSWGYGEASLVIADGLTLYPAGTSAAPSELTGGAGSVAFPPDGYLPAGSQGTLVRVALPRFPSRRYVRFSQGSDHTT